MKLARNYSSPYTENSLKDYMTGSGLTLATCWKLTSRAGNSVAATSHTRDLIIPAYPDITFLSTQGVVPSAVDNEAGLGSAGLEVDAMFKVDVIDEEAITGGDWDSAYFEVFIVNYEALDMGEFVMFAGYIGDIKTYGQRFTAEGRPLTSKSTQEIGSLYTPKCTVVNLGDSQCKINLNTPAAGDGGVITVNGTVTSSGSNLQFSDTSRTEPNGYFDYGVVQFTSGVLNGKMAEVKSYIGVGAVAAERMISDSSWKVSSTSLTGWNNAGFDDSSWASSVEETGVNMLPWGPVANFPSDSVAQWIWQFYSLNSNTPGTFYFRKSFTADTTSAVITIAADNSYILYVNGVSVGSNLVWQASAQTYSVTLNSGIENAIAVQATNLSSFGGASPAGIVIDISFPSHIVGSGSEGSFTLQVPMTREIPVGTTYTAIRGCDRLWTTCKNIYGNLINFRGFPFVPGLEQAYKINESN